jgi:hypothetical protein
LTWLIIGVVLFAAFGPIFWMLPSRSDRRLAKMRARARSHGIQVEMTQLDDLVADASARVSAGGVRREPKVSCAAYRLGLRRLARAAPQWKMLYKPDAVEGPMRGWLWDGASGSTPATDADYWRRVADVVAQLPSDALAVAAGPSEVSCWWRERASAEDAVTSVDRLHDTLQKLAEIQMVADASATSNDAAEDPPEAPATRH